MQYPLSNRSTASISLIDMVRAGGGVMAVSAKIFRSSRLRLLGQEEKEKEEKKRKKKKRRHCERCHLGEGACGRYNLAVVPDWPVCG